MPTLHIEHAITDFGVWVAAFSGFDEARRTAGVREARVHQPVDDPKFVVVDLDFDTHEEATAFLQFLETVVWQNPVNSPAWKVHREPSYSSAPPWRDGDRQPVANTGAIRRRTTPLPPDRRPDYARRRLRALP